MIIISYSFINVIPYYSIILFLECVPILKTMSRVLPATSASVSTTSPLVLLPDTKRVPSIFGEASPRCPLASRCAMLLKPRMASPIHLSCHPDTRLYPYISTVFIYDALSCIFPCWLVHTYIYIYIYIYIYLMLNFTLPI